MPEWLLACDYIVDVSSTHFANKTFKIILLHRLFYVSELFLFKASVWWPIVMITMGHHTSALILIGSFFNCSKFNSLAALCKVSTSLPLANHCVYYSLLCFIPFFQNYIIIFLDSVTCGMCPKTRYLSSYDKFFLFMNILLSCMKYHRQLASHVSCVLRTTTGQVGLHQPCYQQMNHQGVS